MAEAQLLNRNNGRFNHDGIIVYHYWNSSWSESRQKNIRLWSDLIIATQ